MSYYEEFLKLQKTEGVRARKTIDYLVKHHRSILEDAKTYTPPGNYKYLITFTVDQTKGLSQDWIEKYIVKLIKNDNNIYTAYYVKEHPDSNVHWHVVVKSTKPYKYNKLDYYKHRVGRVDVSRSVVKTDEFSSKYLEKESQIIIIKGELTKKEKVQKTEKSDINEII